MYATIDDLSQLFEVDMVKTGVNGFILLKFRSLIRICTWTEVYFQKIKSSKGRLFVCFIQYSGMF